uniref:Dynein light chain Tctex-type 1 n=1 Tax=Felis catus TaxID=9685 RepID=A0ABI7Y888_FELCA
MEDYQAAEETAFVVDEVSNIVKEAIESAIGGNAYQHSKVNQWTTNVVEQTLSQLTKLGKPFKYIVTCVIMQKNGAGLHTASSCFWDSSTDAALCGGRIRPCTASLAPSGCPSEPRPTLRSAPGPREAGERLSRAPSAWFSGRSPDGEKSRRLALFCEQHPQVRGLAIPGSQASAATRLNYFFSKVLKTEIC